MIQDEFVIERDGYKYSDAIVLPEDEYNALTPEELNAMKEQRFQDWKTRVESQSSEEVS